MSHPGGNGDHKSFLQKQKEALEKAKSMVERPVVQKKPESQGLENQPPKSVVTYPEFAPPLPSSRISFRRLLLVLYLSAGTAATMYILSKVSSHESVLIL